MQLIDLIAGARPNFAKIAPIIHALNRLKSSSLSYRFIHTGQHYDQKMSGSFLEQLGIPDPHINLGAGSGSQAEQTGSIMCGYERVLVEHPSDLCVVVGDVNSTMACSIAAKKESIPVAHVEAGIRSGDWSMPEEVNRVITDSIADYFFTTSRQAGKNLVAAGTNPANIFFVGNTMIDTLLVNIGRAERPSFLDTLPDLSSGYLVLTLHRPANVDDPDKLQQWLHTISDAAAGLPILFPVHPRTRKLIKQVNTLPKSLHLVDPQPYLQFLYLIKRATAVLTDSGGITEETTVLHIPCLTLRDSTERPETVQIGTNELIGTSPQAVKPALNRVLSGRWKQGAIPERWDGRAGERIVAHLRQILAPTSASVRRAA